MENSATKEILLNTIFLTKGEGIYKFNSLKVGFENLIPPNPNFWS